MPYREICQTSEHKMKKAIEVFVNNLKGIRSGRASPALVEDIKIDYYGSPTPLKQLAVISIPEPRLIILKPFDPSTLSNIEKSVLKSDIGINPINDGKLIRLVVPPLSEERRKQMTKLVKERAEEARVAIRNVRREANRQAEDEEKKKTMSEDEKFRLKEEVNKTVDTYEKEISEIIDKKNKEIMEG